MNRHRSAVVLHAVDSGARKRERFARAVLAHMPWPRNHERLVPGVALDDVDADAGAAVVVVARISRLPPRVEPGFRVLVSPEELERSLAASLELGDVDQLGRRTCEASTLLGRQVVV